MAISAYRCAQVAEGNCPGVNTFSIRQEGAVADAATLHHRFVTMTTPAGICNVCATNRGRRIARRQNRCHIAVLCMAIKTRRSSTPIIDRLGMKAMVVVVVRTGMKQGSGEVRQGSPWAMTALAIESRGWNRRSNGFRPADHRALVGPYGRL